MRSLVVLTAVAVLALAATTALAQGYSVPAQSGTGPAVGLTPCQQAGVGAGPAPTLYCLTGPDFDRAYVALMYQLHINTIALATQGIQQAADKQLKNLSGKVRYEQTKQNEKFAQYYMNLGCGSMPACYAKAQDMLNTIVGLSGHQFDIYYAKTMATILQQQADAATLGAQRITIPELRNQAGIVANATQIEALAFQRWVNINATLTQPAQGTY